MATSNLLEMSLDDIVKHTQANHRKPANQSSRLAPSPGGRRTFSDQRKSPMDRPIAKYARPDSAVEGFGPSRRNVRNGNYGQYWDSDDFSRSRGPYRRSPRGGGRGTMFMGQRRDDWSASGSWRPNRCLVRISNLDYSIMKEDLEELFGSLGEVVKCWIDYDRTDRSEGTGGCIFKNEEDAIRAVNLFDGRKIEGMAIRLEINGPPPNRTSRYNAQPHDFTFLPEECPW